jgi:hypothetical protein
MLLNDMIVTLKTESGMELSEMLSVSEAVTMLREYRILHSEQMLRRWLRQGKIKGVAPTSRKEGWRIPIKEVWHLIMEPAMEGTPYEYGIDEQTMIQRLIEENKELKNQVRDLRDEIYDLRVKLGLDDGIPF